VKLMRPRCPVAVDEVRPEASRDGDILALRLGGRKTFLRPLLQRATRPYLKTGPFGYLFARGKLAMDPVFQALLAGGLLTGRKRILDLGCGQGLLAAWLHAAKDCYENGCWPGTWPAPPAPSRICGIELMASDVKRARRALGSAFEIFQGDIRTTPFGTADAIVILDVLHYLPVECQEDTLRRARAALPDGGLLLLRVSDAGAGVRFRISCWLDKATMLGRGHGLVKIHCRSLMQWRQALDSHGFNSTPVWMSQGTPFANILLIAEATRRRA
jgi:SAM-dependent methyltransferase